jgi:tetratricopeptide (TPR) repeat protein
MPFDVYPINDLSDTDRILSTIANVMCGVPVPTRVPLAETFYRHHGTKVLDDRLSPLPADLSSVGPSDLLQARYNVVEYDDATGMRQRVVEWCLSNRATAGCLIHGAGGLGKTRLIIEVAALLRHDHHWSAGFLDPPPDDEYVARQRWQALDEMVAAASSGLLIALDDAEGRQHEVNALAQRLWQRSPEKAPVRIVLLARSAGEWWSSIVDESSAVRAVFRGRTAEPAVMSMPHIDSDEARLRQFMASVKAFGPIMRAQGYTAPGAEPSADRLRQIASSPITSPLAIQMEALMWLAFSAPDKGDQSVAALLTRVLALERAHWKGILGAQDDDRRRDLRRAVAQVTALRGVDSALAAERLLMADRFYDNRTARASVEPVVRNLATLYGRTSGHIGPLEPDLIGEHHVGDTADTELIDGCVAWIDSQAETARAKRRRAFVRVLQRATLTEHGEVVVGRACELLDHLIGVHGESLGETIVEVMGDSPGALFDRVAAQIETLSEPTLGALNFALPIQRVSWREFSLRVAMQYVKLVRREIAAGAAANRPSLYHDAASGLRTLGFRLADVGRHETALAVSKDSVDIYRVLSEGRPDAFLPELASSLNNLAVMLSNLERHEEAVAANREAIDIRRRLAKANPGAVLPNLARSLSNLGTLLMKLRRAEEGLAAAQEAIEVYRTLAETEPNAFLPDLGTALNTAGVMFVSVQRGDEALAALTEAVAIKRTLANEHPDPFLGELAGTLSNLGDALSRAGAKEESIATATEAVEIFRRLASDRPEVFCPDLAKGLINLSAGLRAIGRPEDAIAIATEAVDIYRKLTVSHTDAFVPDLAVALNMLATTLAGLDRYEEALGASEEAIAVLRAVDKTRSDAVLPALGWGLHTSGGMLAVLGRADEALARCKEAVEIRRLLAKKWPDDFLQDLARSLQNLGVAYSKRGDHSWAFDASDEAVRIFRGEVGRGRDAVLPDLAMGLGALSQVLAEMGRYAEAADAAREALATIIGLFEAHPGELGGLLEDLGRSHISACQRAGREPDRMLLERAAIALGWQ